MTSKPSFAPMPLPSRPEPRDDAQWRATARLSQDELDRELVEAAETGGLPRLLKLLAQGANPHARPNIGKDREWASTALIRSVRNLRFECIEALLPLSDPLAVDNNGNTALILAANWGRQRYVEMLLPVSDIHATADDGMGAMECAKSQGHELIAIMIQAEAARRESCDIHHALGDAGRSHASSKRPL